MRYYIMYPFLQFFRNMRRYLRNATVSNLLNSRSWHFYGFWEKGGSVEIFTFENIDFLVNFNFVRQFVSDQNNSRTIYEHGGQGKEPL